MFQGDINALNDKLEAALTRIAELEDKTAKDIDAMADKVIAAFTPKVDAALASFDKAVGAVNTLTVTASGGIEEVVNSVNAITMLVKRGAVMNWGPEQ